LLQDLRQAAARCEQTAGEIAGQPALLDLRLQLCYEAAWSHRAGAELQWFEERETRQHAQLAHDRAALDGRIPMGQAKPDLQAVEIPLVQLAVAEEERQAAKCYRELIEAGPEAQLALDARLELAEMFAARNNYDSAAKLVAEALEKDPTPAMVDRLLLMQGQCLLMQKDYTAALDKFEPIAKNEKNPLSPEARFRIAEIFYQQGEWQKAVDRLTPFRDRGELQNLADTSERAFFRLGQAYMHLQQWEPARQAFENFVNRFGNSADANEARFMIGLARSNMKQYDDAVNWLQQVVHRTATERGAEANLLIGRCRLEQKRFPESLTALTAAATWYDFREPAAEALLETARLHVEQKQPDSAKKALQQVLDRFPDSPWSENAKKRLAELK
jgi:TolA-binding protein